MLRHRVENNIGSFKRTAEQRKIDGVATECGGICSVVLAAGTDSYLCAERRKAMCKKLCYPAVANYDGVAFKKRDG